MTGGQNTGGLAQLGYGVVRAFGSQPRTGDTRMGKLDGKAVLIVGAANAVPGELQDFGGASAWMFTREGASIVLADIADEMGELSAQKMREAGGDASYIHLDVTKLGDWNAAMDYTIETHGKLNVMIYSADFIGRYTIATTSVEEWDHSIAVNLTGVFLGLKAA